RLQQSRNRGEKLTLNSGRRARIRPFAHPLEHAIDDDEVERAVGKWKFQCSRLRKVYVRDLILKQTFASEFDTRRYGIYRVDVASEPRQRVGDCTVPAAYIENNGRRIEIQQRCPADSLPVQ